MKKKREMTMDEKIYFLEDKLGHLFSTERNARRVPCGLTMRFDNGKDKDDEDWEEVEIMFACKLDRGSAVWNWQMLIEEPMDFETKTAEEHYMEWISDELKMPLGGLKEEYKWRDEFEMEGWYRIDDATLAFLVWIFEHAVSLDEWKAGGESVKYKFVEVKMEKQRELNEDTYVEPGEWGEF